MLLQLSKTRVPVRRDPVTCCATLRELPDCNTSPSIRYATDPSEYKKSTRVIGVKSVLMASKYCSCLVNHITPYSAQALLTTTLLSAEELIAIKNRCAPFAAVMSSSLSSYAVLRIWPLDILPVSSVAFGCTPK